MNWSLKGSKCYRVPGFLRRTKNLYLVYHDDVMEERLRTVAGWRVSTLMDREGASWTDIVKELEMIVGRLVEGLGHYGREGPSLSGG